MTTTKAWDHHRVLLEKLQRRIAETPTIDTNDAEELVALIREEAGVISDVEVLLVLRRLREDSVGIGALERLLATPGVTDIVVNGPDAVWFDRGDGLERSTVSFPDAEAVRQLATRLISTSGGRLDDARPFADGRVRRDDGAIIRVHAVLQPPSESGTCLSLRVLRQATTSLDDLIGLGTLTEHSADLVRAMIAHRQSFLIVGGIGSGKTTLLSALLAEVRPTERLVCIEDTAELAPKHPHVINLVARQSNTEGEGAVSLAELLRQALRMRPDRIVIGEIRGAEIVDLLAALNTGHDGGAGTIHANTLSEVPARIESLAALGGLSRQAAHSQLLAAVQVILVVRRGPDGQRRLVEIGHVTRGASDLAEITVAWRYHQEAKT